VVDDVYLQINDGAPTLRVTERSKVVDVAGALKIAGVLFLHI
jgi:hypothetical protein